MKRIWLLAFSLLVFLLSFNISFAASNAADVQEMSPTPNPKVDYELPYPGLLPDSSMYSLRMIRDKIVSFLISDPLKKAEFDLLQADKRLNAGIYLFNKGKISMSISTISKAENYFEQALQKTKEAKKQGMETTGMTNKLIASSKKHQEELNYLEEKSPQNFKTHFNSLRKRVSAFETKADSLGLKE